MILGTFNSESFDFVSESFNLLLNSDLCTLIPITLRSRICSLPRRKNVMIFMARTVNTKFATHFLSVLNIASLCFSDKSCSIVGNKVRIRPPSCQSFQPNDFTPINFLLLFSTDSQNCSNAIDRNARII